MCVPLAAPAAALSLGGKAVNFAQESALASARQGHSEALSARNQQLARASSRNQFDAIGARVIEEAHSRGAAAMDLTRNAIQARARIAASAAEAGVSGGAVDAVLADFGRQEGTYLARNRLSQEFTRDQARRDLLGVNLGLNSRLLASTPDVIAGPNLLGSAVGAFSSAFSTALSVDNAASAAGKQTLFV